MLVETQEAFIQRRLIKSRIKKVSVAGYPAKYKNFRPVDNETLKQRIVNGVFLKNTVTKKH